MKLSQFKNTGKIRKITFVNGVISETNEDVGINGEITFYELNYDKLVEIQKNVIDKINVESMEDEGFIYLLMPYICDIEVDITEEDFLEMIKSPSNAFTHVLNSIIDVMQNVVDYANAVSEISEKSEKLDNNVMLQKIETKEEKMQKLYTKLINTEDKDTRIEILKEIQLLETE